MTLMYRKTILILLLMVLAGSVRAQLAAEWLRQNQTQRRYLAIQIAALQQYLSLARQGYQAVSGGLQVVGQIKRGEFDIHSAFFSSLQYVSPFIRRHQKVLNLAGSYASLIEHFRRMRARWETIEGFPSWKRSILVDAYLQFSDDLARDLLFLTDLLTDRRFELNDAERLEQVGHLAARQELRRARIRQLSDDFERSAAAAVRNSREHLHFKTLLP
ncbi:hypothetical protein CCY01nite_48270 [Chitinophaga cymbidii]|uniref:TerB family tellurite resistance protein n=2 Tax=Chitinophaga cymbidii TaxID=1096750 RepID=A0A512RS97_9BACT|nr:hypothetical protein CCY01nite_48270 [Chitinophaga cymbidii]